jgi:hypothetical protein
MTVFTRAFSLTCLKSVSALTDFSSFAHLALPAECPMLDRLDLLMCLTGADENVCNVVNRRNAGHESILMQH